MNMEKIKDLDDVYQICTHCVMDTSDPDISFDKAGVCNHCANFEKNTKKNWFPNKAGQIALVNIVNKIKKEGRNHKYDCILGLSGGVDSSFLALKVHELGLRPLVMHVDAGWNSELAVANIEAIVKHCKFDLHTYVVNWEEMRDLQLAYMHSGIANQDVPQDHIFFASLYHFATKNGIRYILSGGNIATESIFPDSWHGSAMDSINLKSIHRKYGKGSLKSYKTIGWFQYYIWYPFFKKMRTVRPLNYLNYNKKEALEELITTVGYKPYARKHGESIFTRLFQNYYLPKKFGYDKRRPHLSSLIMSGQISREAALIELIEPLYEVKELSADIDYFCNKMGITCEEFEMLLSAPNRVYTDYPNWDPYQRALKKIQRIYQKISGHEINVYS